MATKHYCDVCGDEIPDGDGYTVRWEKEVRDTGGVFTSRLPERTSKNVCESCWPGEESWFDGLRVLLQ